MAKLGGYDSYVPTSPMGKFAVTGVAMGGIGGLAFIVFFYFAPAYSFSEWAPEQPVAFSHKLHAGDNRIDCQYCHTYARKSEMAGVPSLSTCINCHRNIKTDDPGPEVQKVMDAFEAQTPIEWIRVYDLPDHVWFNHKRHIAKDITCQKCHGQVQEYVVQKKVIDHKMGICLNCHQENDAPTDCWTCHT